MQCMPEQGNLWIGEVIFFSFFCTSRLIGTKTRMKSLLLVCSVVLLVLAYPYQSRGQDTPAPKKTIWDIPHKTAWEKFMWVHRTSAYFITRKKNTIFNPEYIRAYPRKFIITLPVSLRYMHFNLIDWQTKKRLQFTPNFKYEFGIGISSRWATFVANTGIAFFNGNTKEKGVTKYNDYHLNLYGKRTTSEISYQRYRGFYILNTNEYSEVENSRFEIRKDVKAELLATSSYYIFNHKKFSYRSTFAFNETQLKSVGSFLLGGYYTLFGVTADSSLVSGRFSPFFDTLSLIKEGSAQTFGISGGYIYTYVKNKFYTTLSVVPGIGLEQTTYDRVDNSSYRSSFIPAAKANFRFGVGYDTGKLYYGIMGMYNYFLNSERSACTFNYDSGKLRVFIGYRFNFLKTERKILKKLSLVGYPGDPNLK